ncbi:hypothetical protein [Desulfomonile tiedjei]|uniref:Cupin domain-containing protein n=1 Tax=Desulfomonile tiedjei (strain ATCC 49306 / DSM 6799 / DCB-1) TaxID=706587 RepID=I4C2T9_DESTA|nr:hypothetical protein [Desulfomonile tiedjei]AFM23880.1 hypothetical protein Desti_1167 [Desulfomonile tiedjei DSM 6799]
MKTFPLRDLAIREGGEYVLGYKDLHTRSCYMIYGVLSPLEKDRVMKPGKGYEEILCASGGPLLLQTAKGTTRLEKGQAAHMGEEESMTISNPGEEQVEYIIAGGPLEESK